LDDMYVFLVRGPSSRFPRGYIWLIPIWFGLLGGAVVYVGGRLSGQVPVWLAATEIGGLVLAGATMMCVLATVRYHAFRVSKHGIWLGVKTTRKRPRLRQVHIAWTDIAQLRMVNRGYGVLLEIGLGPAARIVHRPGLVRQALLLLGSLVMPVGFGRGRPALTAARDDPPRYLVKVCDVTAPELRQVLAAVKPPKLIVRVLAKPGVMQFPAMPRQRPDQEQPARQRPARQATVPQPATEQPAGAAVPP
jgi:hypothetical protein